MSIPVQAALTIAELPSSERPRERLAESGPEALSDAELLAILLRTGARNESALTLGQKLLSQAGGIRHLSDMSLEQMTQLRGIGAAKALQLIAGIELGRRVARSSLRERTIIRTPADAADLIRDQLRFLSKEHFICLFLDTKNGVVGRETLSVGSLNASIVHPREVFRAAIRRGCASILCAHNHPSGDPTPSPEDVRMTERLVEAGRIVGIDVLDHLIIGDQKFVSLKEEGLM